MDERSVDGADVPSPANREIHDYRRAGAETVSLRALDFAGALGFCFGDDGSEFLAFESCASARGGQGSGCWSCAGVKASNPALLAYSR